MDCLLITTPAVEFDTFLAAAHALTGKHLAATIDAARRPVADPEKFLACLATFGGSIHLSPHLLNHASFSVFVWGDERDLLDVFSICSGMSFLVTDTISRGVQAGIITGTLAQWKQAIVSGLQPQVETNVRLLFQKMLTRFEIAGLGSVWANFEKKHTPIGYFLEANK